MYICQLPLEFNAPFQKNDLAVIIYCSYFSYRACKLSTLCSFTLKRATPRIDRFPSNRR